MNLKVQGIILLRENHSKSYPKILNSEKRVSFKLMAYNRVVQKQLSPGLLGDPDGRFE